MSMKLSIPGGVSIDFGELEPCTEKEPPVKKEVKVGQKVRFDPFRCITGIGSEAVRGNIVTGIVVMVNEPHQWFSVEYYGGGGKFRDSFKFCDIGTAVIVDD